MRVSPITLENRNVRHVALVPAESVRVPFTIWFAVILNAPTPAEVLPAIDRLLKVLAPKTAGPVKVVFVRDTLWNVVPVPPVVVPLICTFVPEQIIVEVPALNVRFVPVLSSTAVAALNVTVLLPKLIVRVLLLLDESDVAVTLKLLVVKVPPEIVIEPDDAKAS